MKLSIAFTILLAVGAHCAAQSTPPPFPPDSAQLSQPDLRDILGLLCPGQEYIGQESGCHVCPPQTAAPGAKTDSTIVSAVRGHFIKPDSDDLLLVLYGCAPHAGNFRNAILFTRSSSGWFVNKADDLPIGQCRKVPARSGRDALVCFTDVSFSDQRTGLLTFHSIAADQKLDLLRAFDNTGGACDAPKRVVIQSAIQEVRFVPGPEGKLTLRIVAQCRRGLLSARSQKICSNGAGFEDIGPAAPFRLYRIDYNFNGETFSLAALSRASKLAFDACSVEPK